MAITLHWSDLSRILRTSKEDVINYFQLNIHIIMYRSHKFPDGL